MDSFTTKVQIGNLEGTVNWATWKYKISIMLRGTEGAMEVTEGKLQKPILSVSGGDAATSQFNLEIAKYRKADCSALLILTTNMSEDTLKKVMRFETACEVWNELHRLFDGQTEDRAYNLCMEFFSFKHNKEDDVSTHMSKLKNVWNNLNVEITRKDANAKLPDLFLICKILDTLSERYFAFKSSWFLLSQSERTIDNLTSHLCAFERALDSKEDASQQALVTIRPETQMKKNKDEQLICNYCSGKGHRVRRCKKWIKDGRPPKPNTSAASSTSNQVQNITLMVNACSKGQTDRESWYVDNGATTHIAVRSDYFKDFHEFGTDHTVTTADGSIIPAIGKGTVTVKSNVSGNINITLSDVWLVPSLTKNLFSPLAAQDKMPNSIFTATNTECKLNLDSTTVVVGRRVPFGGLYKLDMKSVIPNKKTTIEVNALTGNNLLQIYHERFAHQDKRYVTGFLERELGIKLKPDNVKCEGCLYGKSHRKPFGTRERATAVGELIHTDVAGPFEESFRKSKYYVLFKDDYSGYRMVYFIKNKSDVKDKLVQMLQEVKCAGHTVKTLLSDNGGEFDNKDVRFVLAKHGIQQRLTMPYTPEQNGCSERENRTLVEAARSMMHTRGELPQMLWAELINTAAYVLNRTGPTRHGAKVPFELWHGRKPKISHLRIIGSECFAHVPKQNRKKFCKKSIKGRLIGYENDDGYRVWDGKKTFRSRDITFETDVEFQFSTRLLASSQEAEGDNERVQILPEPDPTPTDHEHVLEGDGTGQAQVHEDFGEYRTDQEDVHNHDESDIEYESPNEEFVEAEEELEVIEPDVSQEPRYHLRDRATLTCPKKLDDFVCFVGTEIFPETYNQAMNRNDHEEWSKAMDSELKSLEDLNVWTPSILPQGRKALPCKWVLRIKRNPDGSIDKYKARLVVKGYKQRKGQDYDQTFSPVARLATIRALLSVSAQENLHLVQFDVCTAFLNGKLQEEIYVQQPDGYGDGTSNVWKLNRSLYGLKQASRCWNSCFEEVLIDMGFKQCEADYCLYIKEVNGKKLLITLYVDDGLVAATDEELANTFLNNLSNRLRITTKPASYYLGLQIIREEDGSIFINQAAYANKVLERFRMTDCNAVSTPIEKTMESGKVDKEVDYQFPYREAVGALAYLMTGTRPDIAYAVGVVSRKLENPTPNDWARVKRIMRYIKGTCSFGIKYNAKHASNVLQGYSDADHAGDEQTGRSTTGVACLYAGGIVSWFSQRQASVAISTTEAEIVAASEGARELVWLQRVFSSMTDLNEVPTLKVDNEAAIRLAHNPEFHKRTKHIRVRHFFVRETVQEGLVDVQKIGTANQLADLMTKAVPRPRLTTIREALGLQCFTLIQ